MRRTWQSAPPPIAPLGRELRELLESLPLAACVLEREARVMFWNLAAVRLFSWRSQEVLGRSMPLVPHEGLADLVKATERDFSAGLSRSAPAAVRLCKDGIRAARRKA